MKHPSPMIRFLIRWFVNSLGLWIAASLLHGRIDYNSSLGVIMVSGLVLALVNIFIRPIIVILSFPAVLLSLGLFMIVINGLMVHLTSSLYGGLHVDGFGTAMLAGLVIGLVNYLVSSILEENNGKPFRK